MAWNVKIQLGGGWVFQPRIGGFAFERHAQVSVYCLWELPSPGEGQALQSQPSPKMSKHQHTENKRAWLTQKGACKGWEPTDCCFSLSLREERERGRTVGWKDPRIPNSLRRIWQGTWGDFRPKFASKGIPCVPGKGLSTLSRSVM